MVTDTKSVHTKRSKTLLFDKVEVKIGEEVTILTMLNFDFEQSFFMHFPPATDSKVENGNRIWRF